MAENQTKPTAQPVTAYLGKIEDPARRQDCDALARMMSQATGQVPAMWGTAIVGFGSMTYPLSNGKEGQICRLGFSSRKGDISLYGLSKAPDLDELLPRLGKHRMGKGCLYIGKLSDVDGRVLQQLMTSALNAKAT